MNRGVIMYFNLKSGKKLYYEIINKDGEKGTIFFLNGVMASASSWRNQSIALEKEGYKMVSHDFIGQLLSDNIDGEYTFLKHSNDLFELVSFLNEKNIHLVGTSYGGEVAMKFASMYPELVQSITVIDSVSELDDTLEDSVNNWIELASTYDGEEFFKGMLPSIYGKTYINNNKELLNNRAIAMKGIPKSYYDGQISLYKTFINDVYMTDILRDIKCPSLVVVGEEDTLKPIKFSKIIADNIIDSKLVTIPDCGHVTIYEKPTELNNYIIDFLNTLK
jgi:3-oxoadipate enol-lactonase